VDALSSSGSRALYDVVGRTLLDAPLLAPTLGMMRELGAPWIFGTDDPDALLPNWKAKVSDPGAVGQAWNRWPFPVRADSEKTPRGYFVQVVKP
jgi:hypothetical protein